MTPLTYNQLPRSYRQCWNELSADDQRLAVEHFLAHGREKDPDILDDMAKDVLKLGKSVPIVALFFKQTTEIQVNKVLGFVGRHAMDKYVDDFVRYWLLYSHRPMIIDFLDAAEVPHKEGFIEDRFEGVPCEKWRQGLERLWAYADLPVRLYLGYVLMKTRIKSEKEKLWDGLAEALGKGEQPVAPATSPVPPFVVQESKADTVKQLTAEDSSAFLAYEAEVIKAIVRGAISRQEHMEPEQAVEMARQVIDNATMRSRSFFLLGFAQGVYRLPADLTGIDGLNASRRMWHMAGYVQGLWRVAEEAGVYAWVVQNRKLLSDFIVEANHDAFELVVNSLVLSACDNEDVSLYVEVADKIDVPKAEHSAMVTAMLGLQLGRELSRPGKYDQVFKALPAIGRLAEALLKVPGSDYHELAHSILSERDRREAVARLGSGDTNTAVQLFGRIAQDGEPSERIEARAWLALAKAEISDFFSIYPDSTEEKFKRAGAKMQALVKEVEHTEVPYESLSATVVACLGIAEVYSKRWEQATAHFSRACDLLRQDRRSPTNRGFLWIRFMRAACQVLAMDHSNPEAVAVDLEAVIDSKVKPSAWFYAGMIDAATLFPEPRVLQAVVAAMPQEDSEKKFMAYESADMLRSDSAKRLAYVNWLPISRLGKAKICDGLEKVIKWDLESGRTESAELALDIFEGLASDSDSFAQRLLLLLDNPSLTPDILTEAEVLEVRIRLLLQLSRDEDAAASLVERFRREASSANPWRREQSLGLLETLEHMRADITAVTSLAGLVRREFGTEETGTDVIAASGPIRILYVGGNEIQQRYEKDIRANLAQRYPNLSVDFDFPGWSSNWNVQAEAVRAKLPKYNGLVLSYFVRTQFGRTVRKMCNDACPWWASPGHGKDGITRGILKAAKHAAETRQSKP